MFSVERANHLVVSRKAWASQVLFLWDFLIGTPRILLMTAVGLGRMVCASCSGERDKSDACTQCSGKIAKYVGLIPHDLRRTGARNLVRAGVPRSVAMKITGH
jgi:hypothetical protein